LADLGEDQAIKKGKVSHMISTTVHRTCKQRWFSFIVMVAASLLLTIATLTSTTVHAADPQQETFSPSITISVNAKIPGKQGSKEFGSSGVAKPSSNPLKVAVVVFFTRPLSCAQDSRNCQGNVKSYAPDNKVSCSSPIYTTVGDSLVTNGKACPYLTCNYLSITSCTAQNTKTVFRSLPQPIPDVGNSYMLQLLKFDAKDVGSAKTMLLNGCIYYGNWPRFLAQNTQLAFSWPELTLLSGTLPRGVNMQKILAQSSQGSTKTVGTGWDVQPTR
jgi:hypothetical protein